MVIFANNEKDFQQNIKGKKNEDDIKITIDATENKTISLEFNYLRVQSDNYGSNETEIRTRIESAAQLYHT